MLIYLFKRVMMSIVVLFMVTCITYTFMSLVPGGPFLSDLRQSKEVQEALEAKYGYDQPLPMQIKNYIVDFVNLDFGTSLKMQQNRPVIDILIELFPTSAMLGISAFMLAILLGIPMGCLSAYYSGSKLDSTLRVIMTLGMSVPSFVVATLALIIFGVWLQWIPAIGINSISGYIMPCLILSFSPMCTIGRLARASMMDVINQDYIRTANAKGLSSSKVIFKHALRNAMIPVLTFLGPMTAYILTGSFVVETVFAIPGIGRYFVQCIIARDYPIIMATTILLAGLVIIMNLIVDILYRVVDPRIDITKGVEL